MEVVQNNATYTRHQLEYRSLSHLKQLHHLLKTPKHRLVITNSFRHTTGQAVTQGMFDVELTR